MSLAVPPAQPVNIALSSATFALADSNWAGLGPFLTWMVYHRPDGSQTVLVRYPL
jgi:hypothetical protein